MEYSENVYSYNQNEDLTHVSQSSSSSSYLTRNQEHGIMVSALRQVIISNSRGDTSSSHLVAGETLPPPEAGPCPLCGIKGCYGCAFQRGHEEITKEKKYKGVRKKPSGKWSAEIWDPNLRVKRWLGTFPTVEMAAQAYEEAKAELVRKAMANRIEKDFGWWQ